MDDPVVKEIDVYLNRVENGSMYLLQFPLRPIYRPYGDQGQLSEIAYRPNQKQLRMKYNLHMDTAAFDSSRRLDFDEAPTHILASQEAVSGGFNPVTGQGGFLGPAFESQASYALGVMRDGKLYLTPTDHIQQFRPVLEEPQKVEKDKKKQEQQKEEAETAEVSRRDRLNQWVLKQQQDGEPWKRLDAHYEMDTPEAHEVLEMFTSFPIEEVEYPELSSDNDQPDAIMDMLTDHKESDDRGPYIKIVRKPGCPEVPPIDFASDPTAYLSVLCESTTAQAQVSSGPLSFFSLMKLSLDDQIRTILSIRQVESFGGLKALLTTSVEDSKLVDAISRQADMMFGNFVLHSSLAFPGGEHASDFALANAAYQAGCRDLMLALLSNGQPIVREKLKSNKMFSELSMEGVNLILSQIAVFSDNAWRFKKPHDKALEERWPSVAAASRDKFNSQEGVQRMRGTLEAAKNGLKLCSTRTADSASAGTASRVATATGAFNMATGLEKLRNSVEKVLKANGCLTLEEVCPLVSRDLGTEMQEKDISLVVNAVAEEITGGLWAVRRLGEPALDTYRKILISLFRASPDTKYSKKELISIFVKHTKKPYSLPDHQLRRLLRELAYNKAGYWSFKGSKEN
ncbi:MAG: uncharacterized protein KVP18_003901 [Porospora cf. gigantea A]|uniref:uncharacterized protein n=2 Tax=Porospora cf. gigantea A TaxID=2853593 RepID=UPI0035598ACB|nr:MAG: hypothetical protein KVP18_003901 [Porospora cf. gigantea A]